MVCDVGCGDGRILLRWAQHVCDTMKDKTALATRTTSSKLPIENGSSLSLSPGSLPASSLIRFVGIEIDEERTKLAQSNVVEARKDGRLIDSVVQTEIRCSNALDLEALQDIYEDATVFFLYLIPRGLRLLKPILLECIRNRRNREGAQTQEQGTGGKEHERRRKVRVVTYMSPLPDETPIEKRVCTVDHQPGAAWPMYLYEF